MGKPAARMTDLHMCNASAIPPPPAPVPVPLMINPSPNVFIGSLPAATLGTMAPVAVPHPVVMGSFTCLINSKPAARVGDVLACGGAIIPPCCPTVLIGG
ncbi:MAG: PAAR domain-containing protein [Pseudomonadota bacterium]